MGGVVFRVAKSLFFLPATTAAKVLAMPEVARVPGAPEELVGIALVDGEMLPVIRVSSSPVAGIREGARLGRGRDQHHPMLVCSHEGDRVALVGLEVVATGSFPVEDEQVFYAGESARKFDVGAIVARLRPG